MTEERLGAKLRRLTAERRALLVPGAGNALAARVIEELGFEAMYLSGAGLTNQFYGIPDLGFIGLADLVQHTTAIRESVPTLPLIVDADTGFGNALNVRHTVLALERAGADAIQMEDQVSPKKCGHFAGQGVISKSEAVGKVKAFVDSRRSADTLLIARTDARGVEGIEAALDRAAAYAEAGADITFVEAPVGIEELKRIATLKVPQVINIVIGGKTAPLPQKELAAMGFGLTLYANAALQGAVRGMMNALSKLRDDGVLPEIPELVATFAERQAMVRKPMYDALDKKYAS